MSIHARGWWLVREEVESRWTLAVSFRAAFLQPKKGTDAVSYLRTSFCVRSGSTTY